MLDTVAADPLILYKEMIKNSHSLYPAFFYLRGRNHTERWEWKQFAARRLSEVTEHDGWSRILIEVTTCYLDSSFKAVISFKVLRI